MGKHNKDTGKYSSTSKFISLVLRHHPDVVGISLDNHGWADVKQLIAGIKKAGHKINMDILEEIVRTDEKGRYSFNEDKTLIRANQGHSIHVDVELQEKEPPEILYHGTAGRSLGKILSDGLKPMGRLYVHLSKDIDTALQVGQRHGKPIVLKVHSGEMYRNGIKFYLSENGVWLVNNVETKYLEETEI
ncbi:MAG: RNA 2'-phosphotransferase [Lachnospiraceae bacterium]|jgi:RNA:NAD 2''-phosphotransferase|nr:RNA 2'-phosphotransferase [Lachnospiraceae bacterium]